MNISLAVTIPEEVKYNLAAGIQRLKPVTLETLWVERDQLQLPIVTIGEIAPAFYPHIAEVTNEICEQFAAFTLSIFGYGFLGTKRFPHQLWAAVTPAEPLVAMHNELWKAVAKFGFKKPESPLTPHVLLGICKTGIRNLSAVEAMDADENCEFGTWDVKRVTLYDCKTSKRGKVYRRVNQFPLGG
ncbi:MAG: RNA 2',3'-cyclic phosphodiesterase [Kiritimatiellae bacterium]|nr:RNA 2',3'-cyclic phosphodiesterase [Kiritimatiellia bacterium]